MKLIKEDIEKTKSGKWVNRGKEGTHGEFKTKKTAREQQKAMFARGFKGENLGEEKEYFPFYNKENSIYEELYIVYYKEDGRTKIKEFEDIQEAKTFAELNNGILEKETRYYASEDNKAIKKFISRDFKKIDESLYKTKSVDGNEMTFEIKDGKLIVKTGDKVTLSADVKDPEAVKKQISSLKTITILEEDTDTTDNSSENGPKAKDTGVAQMLIDAINGEWDTIKLYNDIMVNLEAYGYSDMANIIRDINNEENTHIGQLQTALETISPNANSIESGSQEAEAQLANTTAADELAIYED